jgi:hypothetical protein
MTTDPGTERCPLCATIAVVAWKEAEHVWTVDCGICHRFTVDEYLMNVIRTGVAERDDRVCRLLPLLSRAAQDTWEGGGRLRLAGENWQAIAHDVKTNKSFP